MELAMVRNKLGNAPQASTMSGATTDEHEEGTFKPEPYKNLEHKEEPEGNLGAPRTL